MKLIDTPWNTIGKYDCLKKEGVGTIIRYYNNGNSRALPEKCLELEEAQAISAAGMQIAVIFQLSQNEAADFTQQLGYDAGISAFKYAKDIIGQPSGSAIYFAVDFNASQFDVDYNIVPYFEGVRLAFSELSRETEGYKVGAYGSGLVVNSLKEKDLCEYRWLSMSTGFYGTQDAIKNGEYDMLQIYPSTEVCNIAVDYDELCPGKTDIGSFSVNKAV